MLNFRPFSEHTDPTTFNQEYLFSLEHILLPKKKKKNGFEIYNEICNDAEYYMDGGTQCGNMVWHIYMFPNLKEGMYLRW